jgi:hypothetical protein
VMAMLRDEKKIEQDLQFNNMRDWFYLSITSFLWTGLRRF